MRKTLPVILLLIILALTALPCEAQKLKAVRKTFVSEGEYGWIMLETFCKMQVTNQPKLVEELLIKGTICHMPKGEVVETFRPPRGRKNYKYLEWCRQPSIKVKGTAKCFSDGKTIQMTDIFWVFDNDFK